jgi:RNA recognition motif-containing protein
VAARLGLVKTARLVCALLLHLRHAAASLLPARAGAAGSTAVYVGGLQWWTTDAELDALCRPYGELVSLRFFEDKGNGKSKGYALAKFATAEAALRCKEGLNGSATHHVFMLGPGPAHAIEPSERCRHNINGKKCVVTFAAPAAAPGAARVSMPLAPDRACPGPRPPT